MTLPKYNFLTQNFLSTGIFDSARKIFDFEYEILKDLKDFIGK